MRGGIKAKGTRQKVAKASAPDIVLSLSDNEEWSVKRLGRKTAVRGCCACLRGPACGYVLALAGVVLQSVGQMVGVCLPAALRLYTAETQRGNQSLSSPLTVMLS